MCRAVTTPRVTMTCTDVCPICFEKFATFQTFACKHFTCSGCCDELIRQSGPTAQAQARADTIAEDEAFARAIADAEVQRQPRNWSWVESEAESMARAVIIARAVAESEVEAYIPYRAFMFRGARVMWVYDPYYYGYRLRDIGMNDYWRGYERPPSPRITGTVWWSSRSECWYWSQS